MEHLPDLRLCMCIAVKPNQVTTKTRKTWNSTWKNMKTTINTWILLNTQHLVPKAGLQGFMAKLFAEEQPLQERFVSSLHLFPNQDVCSIFKEDVEDALGVCIVWRIWSVSNWRCLSILVWATRSCNYHSTRSSRFLWAAAIIWCYSIFLIFSIWNWVRCDCMCEHIKLHISKKVHVTVSVQLSFRRLAIDLHMQASTFVCLGEETHMDKQRLKRQQLQVASISDHQFVKSHLELSVFHKSLRCDLQRFGAEAGQAVEFFTEAEAYRFSVMMHLFSKPIAPYWSIWHLSQQIWSSWNWLEHDCSDKIIGHKGMRTAQMVPPKAGSLRLLVLVNVASEFVLDSVDCMRVLSVLNGSKDWDAAKWKLVHSES